MTTLLPLLRVKTKHSEYLIDQNAGTVTRKRVHPDASDFVLSDRPYDEIVSELEVGSHLAIVYPDGLLTISTEIQSIEEVIPDGAE